MNKGSTSCERTQSCLDSYIGRELKAEERRQVQRHLEECAACASEHEARTRLRSRLKAAVLASSVPPDLHVRVREQIRQPRRDSRLSSLFVWNGWAAGAVAMAALVVTAGVWLNPPRETLPPLNDAPRQTAFFRRISANIAQVLRVGLGDHVHCAIFRDYSKMTPPPPERMEAELGPEFKGLLKVVKSAIPEGYQVVMAHHCSYMQRKFTHVTMKRGDSLISLVIAEKQPGESLAGLSRSANAFGIPVYQSGAERFQVAGFEAGRYFAFVVSELRGSRNLQIAQTLAPSVSSLLS